MGKTGGGIGTNQYAIRGRSASPPKYSANPAVVDRLRAHAQAAARQSIVDASEDALLDQLFDAEAASAGVALRGLVAAADNVRLDIDVLPVAYEHSGNRGILEVVESDLEDEYDIYDKDLVYRFDGFVNALNNRNEEAWLEFAVRADDGREIVGLDLTAIRAALRR